uniref:Ribosomal protein S16 n=1 Tax=Pavlova sp. NIVA-4/92 TaxID=2686093 RepID=A0A7D3U6P5_9EUKA|nr:ribosomal protein S16 [Pavlova sp. NIVA-4/92]QKE31128.1 ribosomal protein S16 [Pavlova sp. NIVA-4/92]
MVKIRLSRLGKKRKPSYRIVVTDSRVRRDGKPLETVGFYDPIHNEIHLSSEAIKKRLDEGAQVSRVVRDILIKANVL